MDVKPWEPVSGWFTTQKRFSAISWPWALRGQSCNLVASNDSNILQVTLANGQRIIVRALSNERKAARAARKAELAPWMALGRDALDGLCEEVKMKGRCDGDPSFRPSRNVNKESAQ